MPFELLRARSRSALAIFALVSAIVGCAKSPSLPPDPVPPHDSFALESVAVGEVRQIAVYTPPGYAESGQSHPVLYMPDGGIGEDFPHIANTIDALIGDGSIAPVIVVGIENTTRGRDLTGASTTEADLQ